MQSFLEFIVEQEIARYSLPFHPVYGVLFEEIVNIGNLQMKTNALPQWPRIRAEIDKAFNELETELADPQKERLIKRKVDSVYPQKLLTPEDQNLKLQKTGKKIASYYTVGLFFAPSTMSGIDVCPCATDECRAACLGKTAGKSPMSNVKKARKARTLFFFENPAFFIRKMVFEIMKYKEKAEKMGKKLVVRLNGTSDIPWEYVAPKIFDFFPDVQFYDYTKIAGRTDKQTKPKNYHLTVSSTGINHPGSNWKQCKKHLDNGGVVSMVFRMEAREDHKRNFRLPEYVQDVDTGKKYKVIDGDKHDLRHLDKILNDLPDDEGVIAGLRVKGGWFNAVGRAGDFSVPVPPDGIVKAKY